MIRADLHEATILVVDDQEANLFLIESVLREAGYQNLRLIGDSRRVVDEYLEFDPDLLIVDLHMPFLDGFEVMDRVRAGVPADDYRPVLVLTADITSGAKERALRCGARDFLTKPLDPVEVELRIRNLLETRQLHLQQFAARERAELLAEVSKRLAHSLDRSTTLAQLAHAVVPSLARACWVDEEGEAGAWSCSYVVVHETAGTTPPEQVPPGPFLEEAHPAVARALREEPFLLVRPGEAGDALTDAAAAFLPPRLSTSLSLPLLIAEKPRAYFHLLRADEDPAFTKSDIALAREILQRAAQAVEHANLFQQIQAATQARDEVLAIVAHDLRNPLNTVRMGTSMLLDEPLEPLVRTTLERIDRSVTWMNRLVEDLLDVARIDTGRFELELALEELEAVLDEAADVLSPLFGARSITLVRAYAGQVPHVRIDRKRILQVLSNLLGNAVKFTPTGGEIELRAAGGDGELRVDVSDTGPGIPAEQMPNVFNRQWQGKQGDRRGIGLGLPLAKAIVEQHGGRIWLECPEGGGSIFSFTLPLVSSPAPEIAVG